MSCSVLISRRNDFILLWLRQHYPGRSYSTLSGELIDSPETDGRILAVVDDFINPKVRDLDPVRYNFIIINQLGFFTKISS